MLDNLITPNLSGLTGTINYTYDSSVELVRPLMMVILLIFFMLFIFTFMMYLLKKVFPKSKDYRELMSDMYVVGRIKQFAKQDNIDLNEELKEFAKIIKKTDLRYKQLDKIVEEEIKERIADSNESKVN